MDIALRSTITLLTIPVLLILSALASVDESFKLKRNQALDPSSTVASHAVLPDGRILTVVFTPNEWEDRNLALVRLNSDGSRDFEFQSGLRGKAGDFEFIVPQLDSRVVLSISNTLVRLRPDGRVDDTFTPPQEELRWILGIAAVPGGRLVLASGHENQIRIVRLNASGQKDASFRESSFSPSGFATLPLAAQADGKILVGGTFTNFAGATVSSIARLNADGSFDDSFAPRLRLTAQQVPTVDRFYIQSDGRILLSGSFSSVDDTPRPGFARLNVDGSLDTGFVPAFDVGAFTEVNGRLFVLGAPGLVELLPDGKIQTSTDPILADHCGDGPGGPDPWLMSPHVNGLLISYPLICSSFIERTSLLRIRFDEPSSAPGLRLIARLRPGSNPEEPKTLCVAAFYLDQSARYQLLTSIDLQNWTVEVDNISGDTFASTYCLGGGDKRIFFRLVRK